MIRSLGLLIQSVAEVLYQLFPIYIITLEIFRVFQMFLNVDSIYNSLNRTHCMEVLWGYGLGAKFQQILKLYW